MKTRLLFVDDEKALRTVVKGQLEGEGFDVEVAEDGVHAMELLGTHHFELVLLDIRMPRMDGFAVLKEINARKMRPRIIMLTAVDELSAAIESLKHGANDFITKPYELSELLSCIDRVMSR